MVTKEVEESLSAWALEASSVELDGVPDIYHVHTRDGEHYVLKNVGTPEVLARTEAQFRVTRHVHEAGLPIAYLLATIEGSFYTQSSESVFVLMPYIEGDETDFYAPESAGAYRSLGRAYARLHACLRGFDGPVNTWKEDMHTMVFEEYAPQWLPYLSDGDLSKVERTLQLLESPLQRLSDQLPVQVIFLDVHRGNVRLVGDQFRGFIDCDHICHGQRLLDVVTALTSMVRYKGRNGLPIGGDQDDQRRYWLSHFGRFLGEYHLANPFSSLERDHLWLCMLASCFPDEREIKDEVPVLEHMDWFYNHRDIIEGEIQRSIAN